MALRWSAYLLACKAINMVLLRSTSRQSYNQMTFGQAPSVHYKHAGAANCITLQSDQRLVRLIEREGLDVRLHRNASGFFQKFAAVCACVVRYTSDHAFTVDK